MTAPNFGSTLTTAEEHDIRPYLLKEKDIGNSVRTD
jgi:hypothetical protein